MADKNFPGPNINRLIDTDPQIIKVPMAHTEFGSRPSALPPDGKIKNEMRIEHVKSK